MLLVSCFLLLPFYLLLVLVSETYAEQQGSNLWVFSDTALATVYNVTAVSSIGKVGNNSDFKKCLSFSWESSLTLLPEHYTFGVQLSNKYCRCGGHTSLWVDDALLIRGHIEAGSHQSASYSVPVPLFFNSTSSRVRVDYVPANDSLSCLVLHNKANHFSENDYVLSSSQFSNDKDTEIQLLQLTVNQTKLSPKNVTTSWPNAEIKYRYSRLEKEQGWNTWLTTDMLTHALLPHGLALGIKVMTPNSTASNAVSIGGDIGMPHCDRAQFPVTHGLHDTRGEYTEVETLDFFGHQFRVESAVVDVNASKASQIEYSGSTNIIVITLLNDGDNSKSNINTAVVKGYTEHVGTNIDTPGHDIVGHEVFTGTINECAAACDALELCIGFVRQTDSGSASANCYPRRLALMNETCAAQFQQGTGQYTTWTRDSQCGTVPLFVTLSATVPDAWSPRKCDIASYDHFHDNIGDFDINTNNIQQTLDFNQVHPNSSHNINFNASLRASCPGLPRVWVFPAIDQSGVLPISTYTKAPTLNISVNIPSTSASEESGIGSSKTKIRKSIFTAVFVASSIDAEAAQWSTERALSFVSQKRKQLQQRYQTQADYASTSNLTVSNETVAGLGTALGWNVIYTPQEGIIAPVFRGSVWGLDQGSGYAGSNLMSLPQHTIFFM